MNKLEHIKLARWFSWFDIVQSFLPVWHQVLMVLSFLLLEDGTIDSFADLQRSKQLLDLKADEVRAEAKAKKTHDSAKKTVKWGNVEVEALRRTCNNTPTWQHAFWQRADAEKLLYYVSRPLRRFDAVTQRTL